MDCAHHTVPGNSLCFSEVAFCHRRPYHQIDLFQKMTFFGGPQLQPLAVSTVTCALCIWMRHSWLHRHLQGEACSQLTLLQAAMFTEACPSLGNMTAERHFPGTETFTHLSDQGTVGMGATLSLSWKVNSLALALIS